MTIFSLSVLCSAPYWRRHSALEKNKEVKQKKNTDLSSPGVKSSQSRICLKHSYTQTLKKQLPSKQKAWHLSQLNAILQFQASCLLFLSVLHHASGPDEHKHCHWSHRAALVCSQPQLSVQALPLLWFTLFTPLVYLELVRTVGFRNQANRCQPCQTTLLPATCTSASGCSWAARAKGTSPVRRVLPAHCLHQHTHTVLPDALHW